jgi:hypothetical protein
MTNSRMPTVRSESSSSVEVFQYGARYISKAAWDKFLVLLGPAIDRSGGETDPDSLLDALQAQRAQLWVVADGEGTPLRGAVVTRVLAFDGGRKSLVVQLAGAVGLSFDDMRTVMAELERYAIAMECRSIRIYGRKGWAKVLPGYGQPFTVLEKEL